MTQDEKAAVQIVHDYCDAYVRKDVKALGDLHLDSATVVGTGAEEWRYGREEIEKQLERDFSQSGKIELKLDVRQVTIIGDAASVLAFIPVQVETEEGIFAIEGRFTGMLTKVEKEWKFVHSHFSAPLASQAPGNSFGEPQDSMGKGRPCMVH